MEMLLYVAARVPNDGYHNTFIMAAKSAPLSIETASPPCAPQNMSVVGSTGNAIQIAWDPPKERGTHVTGPFDVFIFENDFN